MLVFRMELDIVKKWLSSNKLTLNLANAKCIYFGSKPNLTKLNTISLSIHGQPLEQVPTFKYLGIVLDEALTFESHSTYICKKSNQKNGVLCTISKFLSDKLSRMPYKSLVMPLFDYVHVVYLRVYGDIFLL